MKIYKNVSIKHLNTFGVDIKAKRLVFVRNIEEFEIVFKSFKKESILILGSGSNILFTKNFDGLIIINQIKGIKIINEDKNTVILEVGSGEVWHDFVSYVLDNGLSGLENLSLIPGTVGAAPVQNIGAYGVEVKELIESVFGYDFKTQSLRSLENKSCDFEYRSSIFKGKLKNCFFITKVIFRLSKKFDPKLTYGLLKDRFQNKELVTPKEVSEEVIKIRQEKLPDITYLGNAGSFFKNPVVDAQKFDKIKHIEDKIPYYKLSEDSYKIPAAYLIEACGWKGIKRDFCSVYKKQPLVLVNHSGKASGLDIYKLSEEIINSIAKRYGIFLEREVNII